MLTSAVISNFIFSDFILTSNGSYFPASSCQVCYTWHRGLFFIGYLWRGWCLLPKRLLIFFFVKNLDLVKFGFILCCSVSTSSFPFLPFILLFFFLILFFVFSQEHCTNFDDMAFWNFKWVTSCLARSNFHWQSKISTIFQYVVTSEISFLISVP